MVTSLLDRSQLPAMFTAAPNQCHNATQAMSSFPGKLPLPLGRLDPPQVHLESHCCCWKCIYSISSHWAKKRPGITTPNARFLWAPYPARPKPPGLISIVVVLEICILHACLQGKRYIQDVNYQIWVLTLQMLDMYGHVGQLTKLIQAMLAVFLRF